MREGLMGDGPGDKLPVVHAGMGEHRVAAIILPAAGGVREQMLDGELLDMGLIRWFAVNRPQHRARPEDFVGKPELARFDQAEEGGRGDRLGHASDPEQVIGSDLLIPGFVRQPIAVRIDQSALPGNGDRQSRNIVFLHESGCGRFHRPQLIRQKPVSRQAGGGRFVIRQSHYPDAGGAGQGLE